MTLLVWCAICERGFHVAEVPASCPYCRDSEPHGTKAGEPPAYRLTKLDRLFLRVMGVRPEV
jgi:hypothetical protein